LVWLLGMRWPIELAIRESKDELGLDHHEVRGWRGWHHHLAMSVLAHHVLVWQRLTFGKKAPALTLLQVRLLLSAILPLRPLTPTTVLLLVRYLQHQNFAAATAHRSRPRPLTLPFSSVAT
jgi:hypothetical protein